MRNQINNIKSDFESFKKDFVDVENALSELILSTPIKPVEMDIQKRENPYDQVIQDVVSIQNKYEESQIEEVKQVEQPEESVEEQVEEIIEEVQ